MTGNVHELPISRIPEPTGNPFLDEVEAAILAALSEFIDYDSTPSLDKAIGLACARVLYLGTRPGADTVPHHGTFINGAMTVLRRMDPERRAKLRHPARNRAQMQRLIRGEAV